jgi:hypothetical protein
MKTLGHILNKIHIDVPKCISAMIMNNEFTGTAKRILLFEIEREHTIKYREHPTLDGASSSVPVFRSK